MGPEYVKKLVADATEGPWGAHTYPEGSVVRPAGSSLSILRVWLDAKGRPTPYLSAGDAHFIAAARELVPRLADEVWTLRDEVTRLRSEQDEMRNLCREAEHALLEVRGENEFLRIELARLRGGLG